MAEDDDKRFEDVPGQEGQVDVTLTEGDDRSAARARRTAKQRVYGPMASFIPEDEVIQPPKKGPITFYDLGTRLESKPGPLNDERASRPLDDVSKPERNDDWWNQYVPMALEIEGGSFSVGTLSPSGSNFFLSNYYSIPQEEVLALDRKLLGLEGDPEERVDPFDYSEANGSGRKVPNAMQLPFVLDPKAQPDPQGEPNVDDVLFELTHMFKDDPALVGRVFAEPSEDQDWKEREAEEDDALEKWNQNNLDAGVALHTGRLDYENRKSGSSRLKVAYKVGFKLGRPLFRATYYPFDTGDAANFKVTKEPEYTAQDVQFKVPSRTEVRVFLKPALYIITATFYTRDLAGDTTALDMGGFPGSGDYIGPHADDSTEPIWFLGRLPSYPRLETRSDWANVGRPSAARVLGQYVMRVPKTATEFPRVLARTRAFVAQNGRSIPAGQVITDLSVTAWIPRPDAQTFDPGPFNYEGTLAAVVQVGKKKFYVWHRATNAMGIPFDAFRRWLSYAQFTDPTPTGLVT